jgi:hypothetical protein
MLERLRASRPRALAMDREARRGRAAQLSARLLLDMARLGYGDECALGYLPASIAAPLVETYARHLHDGWRVESDFGDTASAVMQVDEQLEVPVCVDVVFDDRSVLRHRSGQQRSLAPTTWRMRLTLDGLCMRVIAMRLERA